MPPRSSWRRRPGAPSLTWPQRRGTTTSPTSPATSLHWPERRRATMPPTRSRCPRSGLSKTPKGPCAQSGGMTTTQHTPNGDTVSGMSVIPVLVYENIQAAHDFLIRAFGFTSGGIFRTDDGTVVHAEVRAGDCPIWLHRVTEEHEMASPKGARGSHGGLEVLVPAVDVHFAKAKDAGARIAREL